MIRNRSLVPLLIAMASLTALPSLSLAQAPQAASSENNDRARSLFRQGAAAMKDGKYADARKALQEAWNIRRTYDVAAILGQAELELKLYRDAAEHLDFALKNIAPRESAETLEKIKTGLQTAKQHVAELRVSVSEPNAQVTVNGHQVGTSPLASSLFVASGPQTVEARRHSDGVAIQSVEAAIGSSYSIDLVIPEHKPGSPASGLGSTSATTILPSDRSEQPSLVPVFIGGGLALAGAAIGIGYVVAASSNKGDVDAFQSKNGPDACSTGAAAASECEAQSRTAERLDSQRNVSTAAFVIAGAAAVGTAAYWFWPRSSPNARAARPSRLLVTAAPAGVGGTVFVSGSF